jgi:hypothetical protein
MGFSFFLSHSFLKFFNTLPGYFWLFVKGDVNAWLFLELDYIKFKPIGRSESVRTRPEVLTLKRWPKPNSKRSPLIFGFQALPNGYRSGDYVGRYGTKNATSSLGHWAALLARQISIKITSPEEPIWLGPRHFQGDP